MSFLARKRDSRTLPEVFEPLLSELERLRRTAPEIAFTLEQGGDAYRFCITLPKKSPFSE